MMCVFQKQCSMVLNSHHGSVKPITIVQNLRGKQGVGLTEDSAHISVRSSLWIGDYIFVACGSSLPPLVQSLCK